MLCHVHSVCASNICNCHPSVFVCLIPEAWMVLCQICSKSKDLPIVYFLEALRYSSQFRLNLWLWCSCLGAWESITIVDLLTYFSKFILWC